MSASKMYKLIAIITIAVMLLTLIPITRSANALVALDPAAVRAAATAAGLTSLSSIGVPQVSNLADFLNAGQAAKSMAVVLGKALFWDMQVGSDGVACATCHFVAGADNRTKNQLNPGLNHSPTDAVFGNSGISGVAGMPQFAPNYQMAKSDFPLFQLADPDTEDFNHRVIIRHTNDVVSSQGVFKANFTGIVPGQLNDIGTPVADTVFNVGGVNVRRVEPRNTPSVINAVFNVSNFWDGRAQNKFNGVNPFGNLDSNASILVNVAGVLTPTTISIPNSSLASQAVGPPLSTDEMSYIGRTFPDIGKKLLAAKPLAFQNVSPSDSVLGQYATTGAGAKGLTFANYLDLVKTVFQSKYWDSTNVITFPGGTRTINPPGFTPPQGVTAYTQAEANFSLFFGLAVQAYESTLVSDKSRFDRFMEGDNSALDQDEMAGLLTFINQGQPAQKANPVFADLSKGSCISCHKSTVFSDATLISQGILGPIELDTAPVIIDGQLTPGQEVVLLDNGFDNTGLRPIAEDIGRGGTVLGTPLSVARQALQGFPFAPSIPAGAPINPRVFVDGAFKVPILRNVELTSPYFHNGSKETLRQVISFYRRHGDFSDLNFGSMDGHMASVNIRLPDSAGREPDVDRLVRFMLSLTDDRVRNEMAPFDHPQLFVPNGHPGNSTSITQFDTIDGVKQAKDELLEISAIGSGGRQAAGLQPVKGFLETGAIKGTTIRLNPGWNTFSTPVRLHTTSDTLGEFATLNGLNFQAAYRWDGTLFQLLDANYILTPLEAVYIQMNSEATPQVIPFEGTSAPPSKALVAGWNLVGSGFLQTEMPVTDALISAFFAPNTGVNQAVANPLWGYSQVVSPTTNMFDWTYVRGSTVVPNMQVGEGYWVYMVNAAPVSGFTSTPLLRSR